ncbi:MAG: hypothetical protein P8H62_04710 [Henriciella sp.]|nr:hypothetical protein [Henriciella sp.]
MKYPVHVIAACLMSAGFLVFTATAEEIDPAADCTATASVDEITLSPDIPCDFAGDGTYGPKDGTQLARFAWNTFIAMNWPADDPFFPPYERGAASKDASFGKAGAPVVWDTWREKRELFAIRQTAPGVYNMIEPPAFNDGSPPQTTGPNPQIAACPQVTHPAKGFVTTLQNNKVENYLDETDEIGLAVLWRNDTTYPTEDSIIRYQVKFDENHYSYVRDNGFWDPSVLSGAINSEISSGNGVGVVLPQGDNETAQMGSILVKTGWMKLDEEEVSEGKYYAQTAIFYNDTGDGGVCYDYGEYGLIGMHIIRSTKSFPYFFFSTFEHKENYPNVFTYGNTNGAANPGQASPYSSTLPNPFGVDYKNPTDPAPNHTDKTSPGYPATRLVAETDSISAANAEAASLLTGTFWENYRLVGVQYMPIDKPGDTPGNYFADGAPATVADPAGKGYAPNYYPDQEYYLANPVVETSQRFQFFEGGFSEAAKKNIISYLNNDPHASLPDGAPTPTASIDMGGCMGCHGNTQETHFSFTLSGAIQQDSQTGLYEPATISGYSADALDTVCAELSLELSASATACIEPGTVGGAKE